MKVAFIGLGNVGSKLAGTLIRNNISTFISDLDKSTAKKLIKMGGKWTENPYDATIQSDIIITCLPSPEVSAHVAQGPKGILEAATKGKIWIEMSTTQSSEVIRLGDKFLEKGMLSADCPVSGGCHRADTGNIAIFAGCERKIFESILPLLKKMGRRILHTGELGSASVLKVVTNYLATANLVSCAEALVTCKAAGMDLSTSYEAIKISSGNSFVHETESQVILNGSRDISFTMDLVAKDIGLFQNIAERHNVPLEISPLLNTIFEDGIKKYGTREWSPNIIRRLEDATGLNVLAEGFPSEMTDNEAEEAGYEVIPKS